MARLRLWLAGALCSLPVGIAMAQAPGGAPSADAGAGPVGGGASGQATESTPVPAGVHQDAASAEGTRAPAAEPSTAEPSHPDLVQVASPVEPAPSPMTTSDSDVEAGDDPLALRFELGGYYRVRALWTGNVPLVTGTGQADARDAAYLFHRLRLEPSVAYGPDEENPIAVLHMQIDALDNVVWGDNSRLATTPFFASSLGTTDVEGVDVPSIRLTRAWLQFLMPVGQIRVGRMPSHWGSGILTQHGNGLGEWGDPLFGSTVDRVVFATRPVTIARALASGDSRPTPLIFAVGYDKLVEDPLQDPTADVDADPLDPSFRSTVPFAFLSNGADDVQEFISALMWRDPDINPGRATDDFTAGFYYVYRWQESTASYIHVIDAAWNVRYALGPRAPSFYTEGELLTIQGTSRGLALPGGCGPMRCNETGANMFTGITRVGLIDRREQWTGTLELGYASGDGSLFDDELTSVPMHPDYHVGLLMYQVALAAGTTQLGEAIKPLWSRGGVWNSRYIYPQFRATLLPGVEVHGAFLLAWADELLPTVYVNNRATAATGCGLFEGDCFIGWEADLALRLKWGRNDLMRWDTEVGLMRAGAALYTASVPAALGEPWLWTVQTRMGMVF